MPTPTYTLIDSTTLASSAASVTFSSLDTIAAGYRDLVLVANYTNASGNYSYLRFNGDSGTNYFGVYMRGNGSTATSGTANSSGFVDVVGGTSTGGTWITHLFDFANTDKHKSALNRFNVPSDSVWQYASRWANTSAITSLTYTAGASNFLAGSSFHLYGIEA